MNVQRLLFLNFLILIISLSGCSKPEEVVISGNTPPTDGTISFILIENYVSRSYIELLGRRPTAAELEDAVALLHAGGLSTESRRSMIQELLDRDEFYSTQFLHWSFELVSGMDTALAAERTENFEILLEDSSWMEVWDQIEIEQSRYQQYADLIYDLQSGLADMKEMHRRMINNGFYDQINMGDLNHVISSFQSLLLRHPTTAEINSAVTMLGGAEATLFGISGSSKDDYHLIFLNSNEYYEAQIRSLFLRFLFREPGAMELEEYATEYRDTEDYKIILVKLFSLDEYLGEVEE